MPFIKKKTVPINYTDRDFDSIKLALLDHAKRYYPETYKDFSEAGFGALMMDSVAYIGDILSFYLDYQVNESFLDSALEYNNVVRLANQLGYTAPTRASSTGIITCYLKVPSLSAGYGPDTSYLPVLKKGTKFVSNSNAVFTLIEDINFDDNNNEYRVATTNSTTGMPTNYAIKASGLVVSGELVEQTMTIGDHQRFLKLRLNGDNVTEVVSVVDSEGHEYIEVDYLTQNVVYKPVVNRGDDKNKAPSILKPFAAPRRFVTAHEGTTTSLQFGFGSESNLNTEKVVDPSKVVLKRHGRDHVTDKSFDPSVLMETDKLGVAPSNTTLRVVYRINSVNDVNAGAKSITKVIDPVFNFKDSATLTKSTVRTVIGSLEAENENPILGDVIIPETEELKQRAYGFFATQNRCVTKMDYVHLSYSMPPTYGSIKRTSIVKDTDSFKRNMNMYVISEDADGYLIESSATIKSNLKTWLTAHKMLNDTIDIMNAKIVNLSIHYELITDLTENKHDVMARASKAIRTRMVNTKLEIGEPFRISEVYRVLKNVDGVLDVVDVKVKRKTGDLYADTFYNTAANTSPDGRLIWAPENVIFEIKYPNADIRGVVR